MYCFFSFAVLFSYFSVLSQIKVVQAWGAQGRTAVNIIKSIWQVNSDSHWLMAAKSTVMPHVS